MLFDQNPEVVTRSTQPKTLVISIAVHALLVLVVMLNPDWFDMTPRRTIRIAGEDFDLSQLQIQPLYLQPIRPAPATQAPAPVPVPAPEVVQPPQQAAPPPPPPPQPRPQPPPPNQIIRPDDQLIDGARPDGSPRVSRGNTQELRNNALENQRAAQAQEAQKAQEEQKARQAQQGKTQNGTDRILPPNTNPNALQLPQPSLIASAGKIVDGVFDASRRNGQTGRTGISRGDNNGTFSTDSEVQMLSPNPKGIDFGPYLNQLLTKLRASWYSVMPEMARLGQKGRTDVIFTVTRTGIVKDVQIVANSSYEPLDQAARSAVLLSNPFNKLPAEYETDLKLRIGFLYNMDR